MASIEAGRRSRSYLTDSATLGGRRVDSNVRGSAASDRFEISWEFVPEYSEVDQGQRSYRSQRPRP